ncbi:MAG: phosphoserine phosphatase RsbU/P [Actinomycetota bacterium]|nr:phosphoserine phosphatase RsbU/P [Actinomycetota bacterium]
MPVHGPFGGGNLLQCSTTMRAVADGATSMEEAATSVVSHLRSQFVDKETGDSALPLVRFYLTQRIDELEPALQDFARAAATSEEYAGPGVVCLTLLATAGEEPGWNDRRASVAHKAIPLPSVEAVHRLPMVSRLIEDIGIDPRHLVDPDPALFHDMEERAYDVFLVPEARDCPHLPDQDGFVIPYGIRSVVGFGGALPDGAFFVVVLFSRVPIPASTRDGFAAVALSVKLAVLGQVGGGVFADHPVPSVAPKDRDALDLHLLHSRVAALSQLLDLRARVTDDETVRLEREVTDAEERATELAATRAALELSEARKTAILEGALDCVIGMDSSGRITDFNQAAEATFGYNRNEVIGEVLAEIIIPEPMRERHRLGLARAAATGEGPILGRRMEVSALRRDGTELTVELSVTRVGDVDPPLFSGYVRDITPIRQAAAELAASRERLAHIARTLQTSLLPPLLPQIDGFELGAAFRALGDGYEVGGDFYDAFELREGKWAVSLGDVCGKGSQAAVITALARYTLRAAAMRRRNPAAVLSTLNEAIHRQHPDEFCTAAYATCDPRTGVVELALGGHPHPLLLTAAGDVTVVGTTSPLLGPYESWHGSTDTLVLSPGDALLLYSDGVTEARAGEEFFGHDRLVDTLRSATGLSATATAQLVETTVLKFAGALDDDLAVLVLRRLDTPAS